MARELLQNRRKYVELMLKQGMSVYDIARFYEVRPAAVVKSANAIGITENAKPSSQNEKNLLLEARDKMLKNNTEKSDELVSKVLKDFGFQDIPILYAKSQGLVSFQSSDPVYIGMLEGMSAKEIAAKLSIPSKEVKSKMRDFETNKDTLKFEKKVYKNSKNLALFTELRQIGFSNTEIGKYMSLSDYEVESLFTLAKKCGFVSKGNRYESSSDKKNFSKYLSAEGLNCDEIIEITGVSEHDVANTVRELRKDSPTPLEYKSEKRRREIFKMYSEDLLTQQEIADRLGITRATVISDLKKYKKQHPLEVDKTYLWRQRNIAENPKAQRIDNKDKVLKLLNSGSTMTSASKLLGLSYTTVSKYASEEGLDMETPSNKTFKERREAVDTLMKTGLDASQIATETGIPETKVPNYIRAVEQNRENRTRRAKELKLSWNGTPTTEIMAVVGRSRASVLRDQHQTSNVLRNNNDVLSYVTEKGGDVTEDVRNECRSEE